MWVLKSPPVLVPWRNWEEWTQVCSLLFSRDVTMLSRGLKMGGMWRARVPTLTPHIDATLYLTESLLNVEQYNRNPFARPEVTYAVLQRDVGMSLVVRFAHLAPGSLATCACSRVVCVAIHNLAAKLALPPSLIPLRNSAAHDTTMPSLQSLVETSNQTLAWLYYNYWALQPQYLAVRKPSLDELLNSLVALLKRKTSLRDSTGGSPGQREKKAREASGEELSLNSTNSQLSNSAMLVGGESSSNGATETIATISESE